MYLSLYLSPSLISSLVLHLTNSSLCLHEPSKCWQPNDCTNESCWRAHSPPPNPSHRLLAATATLTTTTTTILSPAPLQLASSLPAARWNPPSAQSAHLSLYAVTHTGHTRIRPRTHTHTHRMRLARLHQRHLLPIRLIAGNQLATESKPPSSGFIWRFRVHCAQVSGAEHSSAPRDALRFWRAVRVQN